MKNNILSVNKITTKVCVLVLTQADLLVLICFSISRYGNKTKHHTKNSFESTKCNQAK